MGYKIGLDGVLKRGTTATAGTQATVTVTNCTDVTLDLGTAVADTTSRASTNWASEVVVLMNGTLTFKMLNNTGDSDGAIAAIKDAFFDKDPIPLWPRDSATGEGLDGDWNITKFARDESMLQVQAFDVTATPNNEEREPVWQ